MSFFKLILRYFTIGQLPRVSTEDRVVSVFEPFDCLFHGVCKFSHFSLFHPSLIIQYSTEECSTVQYKAAGHRTHKTSLRVKKTIPESMPCIVAHSTRRYKGTALRGALYSLSYLLFVVCCKINDNIQGVYHRANLERACNVGCRLLYILFIKTEKHYYNT